MAYSINPNLPKARALAMKLLILEQLPVQVVANKCGVHRSTIYRWKHKWDNLNKNVQLTNDNRPNRKQPKPSSLFRLAACTWRIPTQSSAPHISPHAITQQIIQQILELRYKLKRCAEVIWHHATLQGITVSLSSVRRILRRHHCFDGARKKRVRPDNPRRPAVTQPGELVQTDTIHYVCPYTNRRKYIYTVIDLYSRMSYAKVASRILPGLAAQTVLEASEYFGFSIHMVQADNGPEFGRYFSQIINGHGIAVRHSRLGRPNDNAHIERFNRTIQEECTTSRLTYRDTISSVQKRLTSYLDYYNNERVHLGLQLRTPCQMLQRL
jgi:transposase InsO family protein